MKHIFFLFLIGLTAFAAQAEGTPEAGTPKSAKEVRKARRAARDNGPEVYKGQMALRVRFVTDAVGAQNDAEPKDDKPTKMSRKQARLNNARPAADMQAAAQ